MSDVNNNFNYNNGNPYNMPPQQPEQKGCSVASLVLGICSLIAWCLPLLGYPVTIVGIVLGAKGTKQGGEKYGDHRNHFVRHWTDPDAWQFHSWRDYVCIEPE